MKDLQKRISILCEAVMKENNPDVLLELMQQLDKLFEEFITVNSRTPRKSLYVKEAGKYNPTEDDKGWAQSAVNTLNSGGILAMPQAGLLYRIDHKRKTLTLENFEQLNYFDAFVMHLQTIASFAQIGYTVNEKVTSRVQ